MLWESDIRLLNFHLDRLESSSAYFGVIFDGENLLQRLRCLSGDFDASTRYRIRLLLDENGDLTVESTELAIEHFFGQVMIS